jgi:translation initiation factor 5
LILDPTKFFGCELGAQVKFEAKNDRYIVNGAHDAEKLQQLLDIFIDKFVLCNSCKNPETDLIINKDVIIRDCKACGQQSKVDMRHKLSTYIMKNPPPPPKKIKTTSKLNDENEEEAEGSDDDLTRLIHAQAAEIDVDINDDADEEDWGEDTSADAVAGRTRELESQFKKMDLDDDEDEDGSDNPYEQFGAYFDGKTDPSDKEIIDKAEEFGVLGSYKTVQVLVQVIFDERILKQIEPRVSLLNKFVTGEKHQKALLGGVERLVGVAHPELLGQLNMILKALYDEDLVDEEVFIKWGAKPSKRYVDKKTSKLIKEKAAPFLNWLE